MGSQPRDSAPILFQRLPRPSGLATSIVSARIPDTERAVSPRLGLLERPFSVPQISVLHLQRARSIHAFSIEAVFGTVRRHLPEDIRVSLVEGPTAVNTFGTVARNFLAARHLTADVIHITGDIHYVAASLPKVRTVLTIHDCGFLSERRLMRRLFREVLWYRMPAGRVAAVTVISEATRRALSALLPSHFVPIEVVPDCVSEAFRRDPRPFRTNRPVFLQVGTKPNKNLHRVIEALVGIDCELCIIGSLSPEDLQALAEKHVKYRNLVNAEEGEVVAAYRQSDAVIFASTFEGFGMPIVEANSVGRPLITSNLSPMCEVAGDAACLVDPFNVREIREAAQKLIRDAEYREGLIARGFRNAERFSPGAVASEYARIYRYVAANANGMR